MLTKKAISVYLVSMKTIQQVETLLIYYLTMSENFLICFYQ